jgi:hypothetical protein
MFNIRDRLPIVIYMLLLVIILPFVFLQWNQPPVIPAAPAVKNEPVWKVDKQELKPPPADNKFDPPSQAELVLWLRYLDLAKPNKSRRDILANLQSSSFASWHKETATTIAVLERMVREDVIHAGKPRRIWWLLPNKDRVEELIFGLREQTCTQENYYEKCEIFSDKNAPADQLVTYGYEAVPLLIEHLDDDRFTRAVVFPLHGRFEPVVLRVGDCALAVLDLITSRHFTDAHYSELHKQGKPAEVKNAAESWWQEFQKKGERQMLIEGTKAGDKNSQSQADTLLAKFPKDAMAAIGHAVRNSEDKDLGSVLLWKLQAKNDPAELKTVPADVADFYREFLEHKNRKVRIAAADILCGYGDKEAVKTLIAEWEVHRKRTDYESRNAPIVGAMLRCKDPVAIDTICQDWSGLSLNLRFEIVDHFRFSGRSDVVRASTRKLFLKAFDDKTRMQGYSSFSGGVVIFQDPRICDLAADIVAKDFREKAFRHTIPEADRDHEIERLRNLMIAKTPMP